MSDLISRQDAICAVCRNCLRTDLEVLDGCLGKDCSIKPVLESLPSAEPKAVAVVRCKDCKFGVYEKGRGIYHTRCEILEFLFQDDDYCSYGERKEDND